MNKTVALKLARAAMAHLQKTDPESLDEARSTSASTFNYMKSQRFLSEYCWVVYASGFRYAVVKAKFPELRQAFKEFDLDALSRTRSVGRALMVINNERKATAFLSGTKAIALEGFSSFKRRLRSQGVEALVQLPGIGPITKNHLAKNIGLADVAKADIWLERATTVCGAHSVPELMSFLSEKLDETQHVIDIALWTYGKDGLLKIRN